MTELALLLMIAAVAYGLSRWSGIPAIPLLLGLGMLASFGGLVERPDAAGRGADEPLLFLLELGLTFIVFASGIELNPQRFRRQRRAVVWVGCLQFAAMALAGWLAARLLGFGGMDAMYLALAVSASSTVVVLRQLQSSRMVSEPHGRMLIGVLLLQDALALVALVALARFGVGISGHAAGFGAALLMAAAAWLFQWRGAAWLLRRAEGDEELILLAVLTVLFLFLGATWLAGLPWVVGAFLAGYALSSFPASGLVGGLLQSLTDFSRAVFFVALGALVAVPAIGSVGTAVALSLVVIVITPPLVAVVAESAGLTSRPAIESGLLLAQTSEYSLILGLIGLRMGHIGPEVFAILALMAVLTMTATPLLAHDGVARALMRIHPLRKRRLQRPHDATGRVLMLGCGSAGQYVLRPLIAAGVPLLVVDEDPGVINELDEKGVPCLRGDGSDEHLLEQIHAREARLVIASMRRVADAKPLLERLSGLPVLVRVFEDFEAEAILAQGGIPVSGSEEAVTEFLKWYAAKGF